MDVGFDRWTEPSSSCRQQRRCCAPRVGTRHRGRRRVRRRRTRCGHRRGARPGGVPGRRGHRGSGEFGSRSVSVPTTGTPSRSSTATFRRVRRSPVSSRPWPRLVRRIPPGTPCIVWRLSASCAGGSNRNRGSSAWNRFVPNHRCHAGAQAPNAVLCHRAAPRRLAGRDRLQRRSRPRRHPVRGRRPPGVAGVGVRGVGSPVETIVVVPERDLLPVTTELASQLRHSVSLLAL